MAIVLKVGSLDLSRFVRVAHDEGMDPANPEYTEPQFGGSTAFGEGQGYIGDTVGNREMSFPLNVGAKSTDLLYQQIREIDAALVRGAQVEYRSGGASQSTFFDLEGGHFEPEYQFWLDQAGRTRGMLHLWVRPRGTSGTTRLLASVPMGSAAAVQVPLTNIGGDVAALANLEVRVGSAVASNGRVVAYGLHPHPSFMGLRTPTPALAQPGATVIGASGALASQFLAIPVSPTTASGIAYTAFLDPPEAHVGRHRVIALGRSGLNVPLSLKTEDRYGNVIGTALATQTDQTKWQIIDLGEVQVPSRMTGQEPVPTQFVNIRAGGASGALINASPAFQLDGLVFLPLDYSAGILRTKGGLANVTLFRDSFDRLGGPLDHWPNSDGGAIWSKVAGVGAGAFGGYEALGFSNAFAPIATQTTYFYLTGPNASAIYALGSGALNNDVIGELSVGLSGPSGVAAPHAASAAITFYPKGRSNASAIVGGVGARLQFGPSQTLQIVSASSNGATAILASAGIASTLASGLFLGQPHRLTMRILGGRMDLWLATGAISPSPILSVSTVDGNQVGWPVLGINAGSNVASAIPYADNLRIVSIAEAPLDIGARESFRFESYPQKRVIQGNASVFRADRVAEHRGNLPQIPPTGSPAATGPAQLVVLQGEIDNMVGNDGADVIVSGRERFAFLR